jgi:hypothetical protein
VAKRDLLTHTERSYVGGTQDEDEWIPYSSRRIRPPTMGFSDTTSGI